MSRSTDVVVVGGGIVGLCTALAVADRGMQVTVLDDDQPCAASRASAGMLAPSLPGLPNSLRDLACAARDRYPDLVLQLRERSGVKVELDRSGIIELAATAAALEALHAHAGGLASRLTRSELASLEPALATHFGALLHPLDGWVDNRALMDALWVAAERHARIAVLRHQVREVDVAHGAASATTTNGTRIGCSRIVIAGGAWCSDLQGLPRRLPVRPLKGELLTLDRAPVRHVVAGADGYLVPRGRTLLVGATSEEAGFDATPSVAGGQFLTGVATEIVPKLANARVAEHWGGLRPFSPDGMPLLGPDAIAPSLLYACGFSRNGILLAPWAGEALATLLADGHRAGIPSEFDPGRFGGDHNYL